MNKNWKTNLGGAIAVTGTGLIAVGVLPQLSGTHSDVLWIVALAGFILSCIGKGITALFAADASTVQNVANAVDKINTTGPDPTSPPATTKSTPPFNPNNP